jgi:hypothetical protein
MKYKGKIYSGEQPAIVHRKVWNRAHGLLETQERGSENGARNRQGALLKGLLVCAGCGKAMVAGYTTQKGRRYPYYICLTAQKHGARACPGTLVSGQRMEAAVVEALYQVAGQARGKSIQQAMPVDRTGWEALDRQQQHQVLAAIVERITYDWRLQQGRLRLRPEVTGKEGEEVPIRAGKAITVHQRSPPHMEKPAAPALNGGLPRITKLMALAVRFEELLRLGTAKDYADLARLGGVSRARITQVMNLRNLAPVLQEQILSPQYHSDNSRFNEGDLRRITGVLDWREQLQQFERLTPRKARRDSRLRLMP